MDSPQNGSAARSTGRGRPQLTDISVRWRHVGPCNRSFTLSLPSVVGRSSRVTILAIPSGRRPTYRGIAKLLMVAMGELVQKRPLQEGRTDIITCRVHFDDLANRMLALCHDTIDL
jgi:hypothetical protein